MGSVPLCLSGYRSNFMVAFCNFLLTWHAGRHPAQFQQAWQDSMELTQAHFPLWTHRHMQSIPSTCTARLQSHHMTSDCHPHVRTYDNALPCTVTRPQCEAAHKEKELFPSCCTAPGAWQVPLAPRTEEPEYHGIPVSSRRVSHFCSSVCNRTSPAKLFSLKVFQRFYKVTH